MKPLVVLFFTLLLQTSLLAQSYTLEGNEIRFDKELSFKKESAELNAEDIMQLKAVKEFLEEKKYVSVLRIEGHVLGSENDQLLSEKRAMAAAQWLVQAGVACERLLPVGFGSNKPSDKHSRISFQIAALRGKLIGGMPADGGGHTAGELCKARVRTAR